MGGEVVEILFACMIFLAPGLITLLFLHFVFMETRNLLDDHMNNSFIERILPDKQEKRFTDWLKRR